MDCVPAPDRNISAVWVQIGVIPARYKSSRFPGKALVPILGKPMIVRTWEQACKATSLHSVRTPCHHQSMHPVSSGTRAAELWQVSLVFALKLQHEISSRQR